MVEVLRQNPSLFAEKLLGFKPTFYQEKLLNDKSKRICVIMSRQAGKTSTLAVKAIWFVVTHPKTLTLIVSPSLRQSMIMMDRLQVFLHRIPRQLQKHMIAKMQRTVVRFKNDSQIVALPNSPNLLRGYTAHMVIADEAAFFREDEVVFYNVLYPMLSTTDGYLIVSSTPWSIDSVFYKMFQDPGFSKHVVTWRDVVKAGLIKKEFIEEMRRVLPLERFEREFEARFTEDSDSYLPRSLITQCIDAELEYYDFEDHVQGNFYIGVDLGKKVDYSVVSVVDRQEDGFKLVHMYRFPLETPYASVIGYVKTLTDRYKTVYQVLIDQTGVGEYILEDMRNSGIPGVQGVILTMPRKQEILGFLKQQMQNKNLKIPYDAELLAELNNEKFELAKDGSIKFYHPEGSHDDRVWSLALAIYATREEKLEVTTAEQWKW
ncbi:MAG: terminase large subunit domain-containing protein [Candidatus Bathyarchaeota archaeon]